MITYLKIKKKDINMSVVFFFASANIAFCLKGVVARELAKRCKSLKFAGLSHKDDRTRRPKKDYVYFIFLAIIHLHTNFSVFTIPYVESTNRYSVGSL